MNPPGRPEKYKGHEIRISVLPRVGDTRTFRAIYEIRRTWATNAKQRIGDVTGAFYRADDARRAALDAARQSILGAPLDDESDFPASAGAKASMAFVWFLSGPIVVFTVLLWRIYFPPVTHLACTAGAVICVWIGWSVLVRHRDSSMPFGGKERFALWHFACFSFYAYLLSAFALTAPIVGGRDDQRVFRALSIEGCTRKCHFCRLRAKVALWPDEESEVCIDGTKQPIRENDLIVVDGYFSRGFIFVKSVEKHDKGNLDVR